MSAGTLPVFLKSALWSYDLADLDLDRNKKLIITQIINHGDPKQLEWMNDTYSDDEIKAVVANPSRGMWWRDKLRWWLGKFEIMIDPLRFEVAIREVGLRPVSLWSEFWKRIDREKNEIARRYS